MLRRLVMIVCAVFLLAALPGAGRGETSGPFKVGVLPAADSILLHVAAEEGLFSGQGLNVELIPFQSALELGAAMRAGTLDGHFGDIINVLIQRESGADQAIVATTSHASPARRCFGLVVSPASTASDLADLQGADIAVSSATIIDFLLERLLEREKLPPDFFRRQDIRQISIRLQMLLSGRIEAALLPEPLVTLVESRGARTLLDDRGLNTPLAVIALRKNVIDAETVRRFRAALLEAAARINGAPDVYKRRMAEMGLLPEGAEAAYVMIRFGDGRTTRLPPLPSEADIRVFAQWMQGAGMLKSVPAYADVVVP